MTNNNWVDVLKMHLIHANFREHNLTKVLLKLTLATLYLRKHSVIVLSYQHLTEFLF